MSLKTSNRQKNAGFDLSEIMTNHVASNKLLQIFNARYVRWKLKLNATFSTPLYSTTTVLFHRPRTEIIKLTTKPQD